MGTKKFCDFCGLDITNESDFEVEVYDVITEDKIIEKDACENCMEKVKKAIEDIK